MKKIYKKIRKTFGFLFCAGIITTIISIVSYYIFRRFIDNYLMCTILSWVLAVIFAYFSNRRYVFSSKKCVPNCCNYTTDV